MADSASVSTVDDAFLKGFNSANSEASSAATSTGEQESQPVGSAVESEVVSSPESVAGSEAHSAAQSTVDYEQKWRSNQGIVRSQSQQISALKSENDALRATPSSAAGTQAASAASSTVDKIDELEEQYMDAVTEGDKEQAKKIRREIKKLEAEQIKGEVGREVETATVATLTAREEATQTERIVSEAHRLYPYLNHKLPTANQEAIEFVQFKAGKFMEQGHTKPEAISLAVSTAAPVFGKAVKTSAKSEVEEDDRLKGLAPVDGKTRPVKTSQKAKGQGSFEDGFNSA